MFISTKTIPALVVLVLVATAVKAQDPQRPLPHQLADIQSQMRRAASQLVDQALGSRGESTVIQTQQQVIDRLAALLGQLSSSPDRPPVEHGQGGSRGVGNPSQQAGNAAGQRDSGTESTPTTPPLPPTDQQLVQAVWGQLPEQVRKNLVDSAAPQFLPKYEQLIRDYYRRLAEADERR